MHLVTILLLGLASNLDNLGIGVSYGMKSTKIPLLSNTFIAAISMAVSFVSLAAGHAVSALMPSQAANLGGGAVISAIGIWTFAAGIRSRRHPQGTAKTAERVPETVKGGSGTGIETTKIGVASPEAGWVLADSPSAGSLTFRETVVLGLALALNCLASGFGAGASGVSPALAALSTGIFSFVTIGVGVLAGRNIAHSWVSRYSNELAGILLALIGIYEMLQ
jgi:putative sporulation protein YtaF